MPKGRPRAEADESTFAGRVAAEIRRRRLAKNLSAEEAAASAAVPVQTWYNWERGRHLPLDALPAVAKALKCKVRALIPE